MNSLAAIKSLFIHFQAVEVQKLLMLVERILHVICWIVSKIQTGLKNVIGIKKTKWTMAMQL
jgi:hypothetical protein